MMPRFKKVKVADPRTGWSEWEFPVMEGYRMGCCDCGLVHDMEFRVVKVMKVDGEIKHLKATPMANGKELRVEFRARRNERSTAAMRRKRK